MTLQSFDASLGEIRNHTAFGRDLVEIAQSQIDSPLNIHGCGWTDGGCLIFALGLQQWSMGKIQMAGVYWTPNDGFGEILDHVVGCWTSPEGDKIYLDADGICLEAELIARWTEMDRYKEGCRIAMIDNEVWQESEIPRDFAISKSLARALESKWGRFEPGILFAGALENIHVSSDPIKQKTRLR